jgi:hypothetical protein
MMKSITPSAATASFLAVILAGPVLAERGEGSYYDAPDFNELDINEDGTLDPGEVQGRTPLYGEWDRFDVNNDDRIERSEFAAFELRAEAPPQGSSQ